MKLPHRLQSVLWSVNIDQLDTKKDKYYIIHQILIYGNFDDIKWMFNIYGKKTVIDIFLNHPYKNYPKNMFYFVKNYILGCKSIKLNEDNYVTSIHGPIRPRTAAGFSTT